MWWKGCVVEVAIYPSYGSVKSGMEVDLGRLCEQQLKCIQMDRVSIFGNLTVAVVFYAMPPFIFISG